MTRWFTPAEALVMATSTNADLLALSGLRSPYEGKLGVVEEGALADLLLVDGNPLENIKLIEDPAKNFVVIMKDGKVYKNLLAPERRRRRRTIRARPPGCVQAREASSRCLRSRNGLRRGVRPRIAVRPGRPWRTICTFGVTLSHGLTA